MSVSSREMSVANEENGALHPEPKWQYMSRFVNYFVDALSGRVDVILKKIDCVLS